MNTKIAHWKLLAVAVLCLGTAGAGIAQAQETAASDAEQVTVPARFIAGSARYVPVPKCQYVKNDQPFETQLDVFTQEGNYTFCGEIDTTLAANPILLPSYRFHSFTSWADHSCAKDGQMNIPEGFKARCLMRNYFVDPTYYCTRPGDKDHDGIVDGAVNVPIGLAEQLGAFVVKGMGGSGKLIVTKGADIDMKAPVPQYWSESSNVVLPDILVSPQVAVARSYAFPRPNAKTEEEKKTHLQIVVHDRQADLLRGSYFSEKLLKSAGAPIEVGGCDQ